MAVPLLVLYVTVTGWPEIALKVTVNTAKPSPSLTATSLTTTFGGLSLSVIVPMPVIVPTVNGTVSFGSSFTSFTGKTDTVKLVTPVGTISTPLLSVTPLLNVGAKISELLAVPPLFKL